MSPQYSEINPMPIKMRFRVCLKCGKTKHITGFRDYHLWPEGGNMDVCSACERSDEKPKRKYIQTKY